MINNQKERLDSQVNEKRTENDFALGFRDGLIRFVWHRLRKKIFQRFPFAFAVLKVSLHVDVDGETVVQCPFERLGSGRRVLRETARQNNLRFLATIVQVCRCGCRCTSFQRERYEDRENGCLRCRDPSDRHGHTFKMT